MNHCKSFYAFLALIALSTGLAVAQTSSQPTSTTSTNRKQELYDQYHGYNKKATTTSQPATPVTPTPTTSQRPGQSPSTGYGNTSSTPTTSQSQRSTPQAVTAGGASAVRIGVRGGVTYTFFTEDQPILKPDLGFVGGLTFNFGSGLLSFQPEVNYARYGLKTDDAFGANSIKAAADFIEVPLLLKISSGTYDGHRFFVNVGPYASYLASISVAGKKVPIDDTVTRFGFGGALGVGALLKAGPGHVSVEARGLYSFGDTENGFSTDSRSINSQFTVGYSFPLGGR